MRKADQAVVFMLREPGTNGGAWLVGFRAAWLAARRLELKHFAGHQPVTR